MESKSESKKKSYIKKMRMVLAEKLQNPNEWVSPFIALIEHSNIPNDYLSIFLGELDAFNKYILFTEKEIKKNNNKEEVEKEIRDMSKKFKILYGSINNIIANLFGSQLKPLMLLIDVTKEVFEFLSS